jgi:hypothetical protein
MSSRPGCTTNFLPTMLQVRFVWKGRSERSGAPRAVALRVERESAQQVSGQHTDPKKSAGRDYGEAQACRPRNYPWAELLVFFRWIFWFAIAAAVA